MGKGVIRIKQTAKFGHISRWGDSKRGYEREKFVKNKTALLSHVLQTLRQEGVKDIVVSSDQDHFILEYTT